MNVDVHVYPTRDGLYRARATGGSVTAYSRERTRAAEAAFDAVQLHGLRSRPVAERCGLGDPALPTATDVTSRGDR